MKNITTKKNKRNKRTKIKYKKSISKKRAKHIKKGLKLKGGGRLNMIVKPNFEDIPNPNNYNLIYIAIGAKYNKNYPSGIQNTGPYQLMPNFLTGKSLIIIIDTFSEEELEINMDIIRQQYSDNKDSSIDDFDVIIINHIFDIEISNNIIDFLSTKENTKTNLWICNYVVFLSSEPKPNELVIEENVSRDCKYIAEANDKKLEKNVYKWMGKYNFPNILANDEQVALILLRPLKTTKGPTEEQLNSIKKNTLNIYSFYDELLS